MHTCMCLSCKPDTILNISSIPKLRELSCIWIFLTSFIPLCKRIQFMKCTKKILSFSEKINFLCLYLPLVDPSLFKHAVVYRDIHIIFMPYSECMNESFFCQLFLCRNKMKNLRKTCLIVANKRLKCLGMFNMYRAENILCIYIE